MELGISPQSIVKNPQLLGSDPETLQRNYKFLINLGIVPEKISYYAQMLVIRQESIQRNFEFLTKLGFTVRHINTSLSLLYRDLEILQKHYDYLINLGIEPKRIRKHSSLLSLRSDTIQKKYEFLIDLGLSPKKISDCASLLLLAEATIQRNYDNLLQLGILPYKIASSATLLVRNPDAIVNNFQYLLHTLHISRDSVLDFPMLLAYNPDAFAKKLRIAKLEILGLKRKDNYDPNDNKQFFIFSPATLIAKKSYCIDNGIDYKRRISILTTTWGGLINLVQSIDLKEANKEGKRLTRPFKQKFDKWMNEYKKWAENFFNRRNRRMIIKV